MKKGFTRTLEAVIAIILLSGLISWATNTVSSFTQTQPLRFEGKDIISVLQNTGSLSRLLNEYDFKSIDSEIYNYLPSSIKHKVEVEKYVTLKLTDTISANRSQVVGFTYNFPEGINKDSVNFFSETYSYDHNVLWCWYIVPITIRGSGNDLADEPIVIENIEIAAEYPIWNNSLLVYHDGRVLKMENPFENSAYSGNETHRTINVTVQIDSLDAQSVDGLLLFYADNRTIWNDTQHFSDLGSPISVDSSFIQAQESNRGDVLANVSISSGEEKTIYLSYGINGGSSIYDSSLGEKNNTGMTIELEENSIKQGQAPVFDQNLPSRTEVVNRMILTEEGLFRVRLYTWYI